MKNSRRKAVCILGGSAIYPCLSYAFDWHQRPKIALVMKSLSLEYFRTMEFTAVSHQKQYSNQYDLITHGIQDENDLDGQINIIKELIQQRVDAVIISPVDSQKMLPVIKSAIDAGIIVVNVDNRFDIALLEARKMNVPFVGPDNVKGGLLVGEYLAKRLKPNDQVAIIEGLSTNINAQRRSRGYQEAMSEAGMALVSIKSGNWTQDSGYRHAQQIIRENPKIKAILASNDAMAMGAVKAIAEAKKTGQILVTGYDDIIGIKPMVEDGRVLVTLDQHSSQQAVFAILFTLNALKAKKRQEDLVSTVNTAVNLVTKTYLQVYAKKH